MPIKQLVKVAIKALQTNQSRSLLTSLGVIIGVASVILLLAVGSGLKSYITSQMQDIGSNLVIIMPGDVELDSLAGGGAISSSFMAMSASKLKMEYMDEIEKAVPHIDNIVAFIAASSPIRYKGESKGVQVIGTTEKFIDVINIGFVTGGSFTNPDVNSGKKVMVLGYKVADELFGDENPVGETVKLGEYRYTVVGVTEEKGGQSTISPDDKVLIPITTAQRQFNQDNVSAILVKATSTDEVSSVVSMTEEVLLRRLDDDEFTVLDQKEILSTVSAILNTLTVALGGIAAISLLVGGIGIMNIMLVSVTERTHEIGLRKALGATPEVILTQFLIEAVFLSVGGGIIGIILGVGGGLLLSKFMPVTVTLWSVALAFVVSATVGIVFGIRPARKASQLSPIEALRYE